MPKGLHIPLRDGSLCFIHSTTELRRDCSTWVNQRAVAPQKSHWTNIPNLLCQSLPCWMNLDWLSVTHRKKIGQAEGKKGRESGIHLRICVTVLKFSVVVVFVCLFFPSIKSVGFCCLAINSIVPFFKKNCFAFGKVLSKTKQKDWLQQLENQKETKKKENEKGALLVKPVYQG